MENQPSVWLAADYHLPATYSCRVPMTSIASTLALPGPGPATVRLALIRTALECFDAAYVRDVLFSPICALPLSIRPPERVAFTPQMLRAYKLEEKTHEITEAPIVREMAHAQGVLTIYLSVPEGLQEDFRQLLEMIGYWGQASSLAWCHAVDHRMPRAEECAVPLRFFKSDLPASPFFSCLLSEFRAPTLAWNDVMPLVGDGSVSPLSLDVYVWPLVEQTQCGSGKLLIRQAFANHPVSVNASPP